LCLARSLRHCSMLISQLLILKRLILIFSLLSKLGKHVFLREIRGMFFCDTLTLLCAVKLEWNRRWRTAFQDMELWRIYLISTLESNLKRHFYLWLMWTPEWVLRIRIRNLQRKLLAHTMLQVNHQLETLQIRLVRLDMIMFNALCKHILLLPRI